MKFIKGKFLSIQLENNLRKSDKVTILHSGNPLHLRMSDMEFYIYLKCISYAGNPYPENTTRAQLPKQSIFNDIKISDACFMFWGYDIENSLYVCWDPQKAKRRLNVKTYVSFFSRKNIQESVKEGEIKKAELTNGDCYILFKEVDAVYFLEHVNDFFPHNTKTQIVMNPTDISMFQNTEEGKLRSVRYDTSIKLLIDEMLYADQQPGILSIISKCMAEYGETYYKMSLKDWYAIINTYMKEFDSEQQSEDTEEISVNSEYEPLPSGEDNAEMVSEPKPAIKIKTSSKKTTEGIMYEVQDEEKHVVCEGRVCCSFPLLVMKYLMNNDYIVYNNIVQSFSTHTFFQGLQVEAYKFKDENVEIPRFFLPVKYYPSLTTHNKNRWISEVKFPIDGYNCFISNQWVGHDVEEKSNLRINDFAYMIYKLSGKKYYINFMPSGRKYNMQLLQIKKKRNVDTNAVPPVNLRQKQNLATGWTFDVLKCVERIPNDIFRLEDVYAFAEELQQKYPNNKTIKASIRQKLQILREKGYIEFVGDGKYRKLNPKSFSHYAERIVNLKQAKKNGEVIVAKPVLLLALIDGVDKGVFDNNHFYLNEWLEEHYLSLMKEYTKYSQFETPASINNPFWHLASDGFWHLQLKEEPKEKATPTKTWLKDNVLYASFDDDMWVLLQNREDRDKMRNVIIDLINSQRAR